MTTYKALANKIHFALSKEDFAASEREITLHYDNGTITANELMRLDVLVMEKSALLV